MYVVLDPLVDIQLTANAFIRTLRAIKDLLNGFLIAHLLIVHVTADEFELVFKLGADLGLSHESFLDKVFTRSIEGSVVEAAVVAWQEVRKE